MRECANIKGGVYLAQVYNNTNLAFVVLAASTDTNSVYLVDMKSGERLAQVQFSARVIDMILVGSYLVVAEAKMCYVFNFDSEQGLD